MILSDWWIFSCVWRWIFQSSKPLPPAGSCSVLLQQPGNLMIPLTQSNRYWYAILYNQYMLKEGKYFKAQFSSVSPGQLHWEGPQCPHHLSPLKLPLLPFTPPDSSLSHLEKDTPHMFFCAQANSHTYLIFVIFSPQRQFLVQFFSTQKCVNRDKTDFPTKVRKSWQNQFYNKTA